MTQTAGVEQTARGSWGRRWATLMRLLRTDRKGLVKALTGQTNKMIVFAADLADLEKSPTVVPNRARFVFQQLSDQDLESLPMPEEFRNEQFARRARLGNNSAYGVLCDGHLAHVSWLFDRELERRDSHCYLDLQPHEVEISACATLPEYRGSGLYGFAIREICHIAMQTGFKRVYMKTAKTNIASQRGIEKAGLVRCGDVIHVTPPAWLSARGVYIRRFARH